MSHQRPPSTPPRRGFFLTLARDTTIAIDRECGARYYKLSALPSFTDAQLEELIPVVRDGVQIDVKDGVVVAQAANGADEIELFAASVDNTSAFNRFNGMHTLKEIGIELAGEWRWARWRAFRHVRDLFLKLVSLNICAPSNAPTELVP